MIKSTTALILSLLVCPALSLVAQAQSAVDEQDARSIALDAYIYFYPLVTMDVTRKQLTNVEPGKGLGAPMNSLFNVPTFPTADMRQVVRPNFDTLYSFGYLDLTKEPMVVSVPDTGGRYYLLPMLDMWSDVFASPGWRTTGTQAANFLVTPLGWSGAVPSVLTQIEAPTPYVWIIGRTKTDGPSDYDAVHKIQAGYKVTPLSERGISPKPIAVKLDPSVDMKTPPKTQVDALARVANHWSMNTDTMGVYGNYYLKRAIVAQVGLGANLPEDAIYPLNLGDENGMPLDGANKYTIHFDKGATPPANAFWSLTLYDRDGFQVANSLNRFALSSWMPFKYNPDGSLDLYFQNESPGADKEVNWLPAPKGPFNLTMRLYSPKSEALTGRWSPPSIVKAQAVSNLMAQ